jgi:hypothetical protein
LRPVDSKIGFEHSETEAAGLNEVIRHKGIDRSSRLISPMRNDSGQPNGGDFDRRELSVALQSSLSVDIVSSSLLWIPDHDVYPFGYPYGKYGFIVDMSEFIGQYVSAVWVVTDYSHHPILSLARSAQATYDRYPNNFSCTILQGRNQIADWSSAGDYSASYRKSLGFTPEPTAASNPKSVIVSDVDPYLHIRIDTPALRLDVGDDRLDGFGDSYLSGGFGPNGGSAILGVFVQFEPKKVDILYPLIISKFCKDV